MWDAWGPSLAKLHKEAKAAEFHTCHMIIVAKSTCQACFSTWKFEGKLVSGARF